MYCRRKCLCSRTRGVPNSFCSSRRRRDNFGAETCTAGKRKIKKTLGGRMAREGGGAFMHADDEQRKMGEKHFNERGDKTTLNFLTLDACTSSVHCCFLTGVGGRCCCWSPISFLDSRDGDGGHNYIPRIIKALLFPPPQPAEKDLLCT